MKNIKLSALQSKIFGRQRRLKQAVSWWGILIFPIYLTSGYALVHFIDLIIRRSSNLSIPCGYAIYGLLSVLAFLLFYIAAFIIFAVSAKIRGGKLIRSFLMLFCIMVLILGIPFNHAIVFLTKSLRFNIGSEPGLDYLSASLLSISLIFAAAIFMIKLLRVKAKGFLKLKPFKLSSKVRFACFLLFILVNFYNLFSYAGNLSFTLVNTSRKLGKYFDENTRVIGEIADILCLENDAFSFTPFHGEVNENPIERFQPDFALITTHRDGRVVDKPDYMANEWTLLERLHLCPLGSSGKYKFITELYVVEDFKRQGFLNN